MRNFDFSTSLGINCIIDVIEIDGNFMSLIGIIGIGMLSIDTDNTEM